MSHGIEKTILLFIAPDLAHQEDGIQHYACDDEAKNDNAQHQRHHLTPAKDDPTDIKSNGQANQAGAQRDEKSNRLGAAGNAHGEFLIFNFQFLTTTANSQYLIG